MADAQDRVEQIERELLDEARREGRDILAVASALGAACRWIAKLEARVAELEDDEERPDRCEGCQAEASHWDSEGVPLCAECWMSLLEEAREQGGARG